ncbi:hypothetical protein LINPERHAP2_LOCUS35387 [Linum perenne]
MWCVRSWIPTWMSFGRERSPANVVFIGAVGKNYVCPKRKGPSLGFRDFKAFNQALLIKQSWRIMMEPELLLSRMLKGKYFPSQCFLNASERSNPSWGW